MKRFLATVIFFLTIFTIHAPCIAMAISVGKDNKVLLKEEIERKIELVEQGKADPSTLNLIDYNFDHLGHLGIRSHMAGLVRYLIPNNMRLLKRALEAGADPNFDDGIATPILQARTLEIIQLLLNYGAQLQKSRFSNLNNIVDSYLEAKKYQPSSITDEKWYSEACEAAKLVIKHGENVNHNSHNHPLYYTAVTTIDQKNKKSFLQFLIHHGSDPTMGFYKNQETVHQKLEEYNKELALFIRKERGWYLAKPLFQAVYKKQPKDCYMWTLPRDIMRVIAEMVLKQENTTQVSPTTD